VLVSGFYYDLNFFILFGTEIDLADLVQVDEVIDFQDAMFEYDYEILTLYFISRFGVFEHKHRSHIIHLNFCHRKRHDAKD